MHVVFKNSEQRKKCFLRLWNHKYFLLCNTFFSFEFIFVKLGKVKYFLLLQTFELHSPKTCTTS